jgi:hypothetical protein
MSYELTRVPWLLLTRCLRIALAASSGQSWPRSTPCKLNDTGLLAGAGCDGILAVGNARQNTRRPLAPKLGRRVVANRLAIEGRCQAGRNGISNLRVERGDMVIDQRGCDIAVA